MMDEAVVNLLSMKLMMRMVRVQMVVITVMLYAWMMKWSSQIRHVDQSMANGTYYHSLVVITMMQRMKAMVMRIRAY